MGGYAWVTLATNDSYSLGALVLAHSLKKSNTAHKLAVLITPAVSEPMRDQLQTVFDVVKTVDVLDSKDEAHLALMKRPELGITFTKIHCWRLTEFEKCVFLDADTLVVRNCDELFEREEFSAAPDVSWPDCFNSGVFVYKPSVETFNQLLQFAVEKGSFDGGDQGLLNQFFSDWATEDIKKHLPFVYNLTSVAAYSYIPAFKQYGAETRIVHFIGTGKPWLQQLDPATRTITPTSGSEHLAPLLQQWWDLFCEKVHPNLSKNLDKNNDGMSHPPVEACSNTPVALTSDEPQSPRLIEPCLQYKEKDDYRQHNLPYQPFDVRGSSGELLNVEFLMASVVPPNDSGEQEKPDVKELEEKVSRPEIQKEPSRIEQTEPEIIDDKVEEKQEKPPTPKDPFDYDTFFPDEKCVNNYLEQNVITYQPFEAPREEPQPETIPLPRFLTMPEDDQRQKGNIEVVEHQPSPEPPPPAPPATPEKLAEIKRAPTPPAVEKHELPKSKSMTFIPGEVIAADIPPAPPRSIWKSQPNVNVDLNRKYSMPKLKPLLPRQNSKSIQSPVPRVTLYTEFVMSADYKDPIDLPKDKVGFVETELRKSKSEADLKGKFGPLPFTRSPEVEIPEPKKPPLRELDNDAYDLSRCKRQLGNKPRDCKKENIISKLITPSKDKKSTLIKKRKSKELSPGDGAKEKPLKRERKERQHYKKNENVDEVLKRLWEFSKNYQHFFGVEEPNGTKPRPIQSEFKQFRNFVKDQKETTQKGLLGIQDLMSTGEGTKARNENVECVTDPEVTKIVNGLDKDGETAVTPNGEGKVQTRVENVKTLSQSPRRCRVIKEKHVELTNNANSESERTSENIPNGHNGIESSNEIIDKTTANPENKQDKIADTNNESILTNKIINQNGCAGPIDVAASQKFVKTTKARETVTHIEKNDNSLSETRSNGCSSPPESSVKFPVSEDIPEKTRKDEKQATDFTTNPEPKLSSASLSKPPDKRTEGSLGELNSQALTITVPTVQTQNEGSSKLEEETEKNTQVMVTQINVESSKPEEEKKEKKTKELCQVKTEPASESTLEDPQPQSHSLESSERHIIKGKCNGEINTAGLVNNTQLEMKNEVESQRPSGNLGVAEGETAGSDVNKVTRAEAKEATLEEKNSSERSGKRIADEAVPREKSSLTTSLEESTPKGMFTIGSPEKSTDADEKNSTHNSGDVVSSLSLKQTEKVPLKSKAGSSIPKPDEILCVPDFDTPRSSRILTPVPKPNTGATPPPPLSSEKAIPRKARIQRKPYENGTKYRSPVGKRTIKTGSTKHRAGIAGAIAQLNLETGGKAVGGGATSAAHQEYIRRQNWETGNMDYMGRDSFENIWSKICQTLEGKELDKATESTQSPVTISTEEKTQPERAAGTGAPVSLSTIIQKCPEFIDTLPSEPITGPVEDDEIIFSKPEIKEKSLTNITEEEESGGAAEEGSVKLSDILKPREMTKPSAVGTQQTISTPESKSPEQAKAEEKSQAAGSSAPEVQKGTTAAVPPKQETEQTKPGPEPRAPTVGPVSVQPDETIKPPTSGNSECTTVAIRRPISIPGEPSEDRTKTPAKTPAEKIAEKKLQQKPETPTEPIPLPAPESPAQAECKTVAIPYPPTVAAPVKETSEPLEVESKISSKDEKQKKGVFSKLLEMVGVTPKVEESSKSVFYDAEKTEGSEKTEPADSQGGNEESQAESLKGEQKEQAPTKPEITPEVKPDGGVGVSEQTVVGDGVQTSVAESKQEAKSSVPETGIPAPDLKPSGEGEGKPPCSGSDKKGSKLSQAPMPKPARNASPKPPSPLTIPQTPPDTALTVATPTPPPEPPKRRNSALLKVDESIPATPPVPEPQKESAEPVKSEVENIIEKAKTEVESILLGRRSSEKEVTESTDLINTMKLMMGGEAEEVEELKVTSEEERQRHRGEVASSKLSDQILKAIPPPRRKAISESKSEASGSSGAIPKSPAPAGEKPKPKPSSIPVPPPRSKGKPSTPAPPKGKTKK